MGNLEHCANLFSNANNRVHNWHFFSQNITKGLWDNSRCKISGLELNQDSSISSGSASGKAKTLREKRTGKRVFKRVHFRARTCAPWDLHKNSLRVFQIHMRTWGLLGGQVGRVNLASLVLTASARLPQNLLLHSGRSAPGSTGGSAPVGTLSDSATAADLSKASLSPCSALLRSQVLLAAQYFTWFPSRLPAQLVFIFIFIKWALLCGQV